MGRQKMRKQKGIILTVIITLSLILIGCGNTVSEKEKTLQQENEQQKKYISELETELKELKDNDQYYFNLGIDEFNQAERSASIDGYQKAIDAFTQLVQKYTQSTLLSEANKYIEKSKSRLNQIQKVNAGKEAVKKALADNNFNVAEEELNKIKELLPSEEYSSFKKTIDEGKNKPLEVSLRDIQAEPLKYAGERIRLRSLKVMDNDISRAAFRTYLSTGKGFTDYDGDVSIEIFYDKTEDVKTWRNLSSKERPVIDVTGIFRVYSNNLKQGYIEAETINL